MKSQKAVDSCAQNKLSVVDGGNCVAIPPIALVIGDAWHMSSLVKLIFPASFVHKSSTTGIGLHF